MRVAHDLARQCLPAYSCKFSRHDFTLPHLFACLCAKELLKRSYRGAEAVLRDSPHWCHAIGMRKVPDHNTLCRAAAVLLKKCNADKLMDVVARWAALHRALGLSTKPMAGDSTCFEHHHASGHYQARCRREARRDRRDRHARREGRRARRRKMAVKRRDPSAALKRLPKLGFTVAAHSHLVLSTWCGTGAGSDSPHFEDILFDAWRRVPNRHFAAVFDAGYDAEHNHRLARQDLGVRSLIPPLIGRPTDRPTTHWRQQMRRLLRTKRGRRRCGYTQRWQAETAVSMMKRNQGSALAGKTVHSRKRELVLRVLAHNVMIVRRQPRVETEQDIQNFVMAVRSGRVATAKF